MTGGVHGNNRLGGNSLLECTVYGSIIGETIPIGSTTEEDAPPISSIESSRGATDPAAMAKASTSSSRYVGRDELAAHAAPESCWVAIHGKVYDLTDFADEHPAGAESIHKLGGKDGTQSFETVHGIGMLEDFADAEIGIYADCDDLLFDAANGCPLEAA